MRNIVSANEALERTPVVQMLLYLSHSHIKLQRSCRIFVAICLWSISSRGGGCWDDGSALCAY